MHCFGPQSLHGAGPARGCAHCAALCPGRCARARRSKHACARCSFRKRRWSTVSRPMSAISPTSMPRSTTPPRSDGCFVPTIRSCPTTSGCRSPTTAAPHPCACPDLISAARSGSCCPPGPQSRCWLLRAGWTTNSRSEYSSAAATSSARPSHSPRLSSTSLVCACSMTGRRAISRPGSTSRWVRFSPRALPPPCRPGW